MLTLWNQLDELFGESPRRTGGSHRATRQPSGVAYVPAVDIEEQKDGYRFVFDLPGVTAEDVDIQLEGEVLTVSGERKLTSKERKPSSGVKHERYGGGERSFGKFRRVFRLPKGPVAEKVSARIENGLLEVVVPKPTDMTPRKIRIGSA